MLKSAFQRKLSTIHPGRLVIGYMTCITPIADEILQGNRMEWPQDPVFDWLGSGFYFWEHDSTPASDWPQSFDCNRSRSTAHPPGHSVIGAVIDPGHCLDLDDIGDAMLVRKYQQIMMDTYAANRDDMPRNLLPSRINGTIPARLKLNQAVIDFIHQSRQLEGAPPYDTVRGPAKPGLLANTGRTGASTGASLVCVRNPAVSIHGFFRPRV